MVLLPGLGAQSTGRTLDLVAKDDGAAFYFLVDGDSERNPTLPVQAGERLTLRLRNEGTVAHDFRVGSPLNAGTAIIDPGETATYSFTVPPKAGLRYACSLHDNINMVGTFAVEGATESPAQGAPLPLAVVLLALVAAFALVRR